MAARAGRRAGGRTVGGLLLLVLAASFFALTAAPVSAHVPRLTGQGASLETAIVVEDPAVSSVYYGVIKGPGDVWYYRMDFQSGERIYLQLISPQKSGPPPSLALMGPGLTPEGLLPPRVESPPGAAVIVREGSAGEAEYEPFTPGAYYYPATIDMPAPADGTYYAAVFNRDGSGPFGLAIGYLEKYTVPAWVRLPLDLTRIYAWQEGWLVTVLPGLVVLLVGGALLVGRGRRRTRSAAAWLTLSSALLYFGSAATVLTQMILAAEKSGFSAAMGVTLAFILLPLLMGGVLLWLGLTMAVVTSPGRRVVLVALAAMGVAVLAGFILGPVLALAAALVPPWRRAGAAASAEEPGG